MGVHLFSCIDDKSELYKQFITPQSHSKQLSSVYYWYAGLGDLFKLSAGIRFLTSSMCWSLDYTFLWNAERRCFAAAFEHLLGLIIVSKLPLKKCPELSAERALEEERMAQFLISQGFAVIQFREPGPPDQNKLRISQRTQ